MMHHTYRGRVSSVDINQASEFRTAVERPLLQLADVKTKVFGW